MKYNNANIYFHLYELFKVQRHFVRKTITLLPEKIGKTNIGKSFFLKKKKNKKIKKENNNLDILQQMCP